MNKAYRVIWNATMGTWSAVSEKARGHSKGASRSSGEGLSHKAMKHCLSDGKTVARLTAAFALFALPLPFAVAQTPSETVSAGATCATSDGNEQPACNSDLSQLNDETKAAAQTAPAPGTTRGIQALAAPLSLDDTFIKVTSYDSTPASATGNGAVAIGNSASSVGDGDIAIGRESVANGPNGTSSQIGATAVGVFATATGQGTTAVGGRANASADYAVAVGRESSATTTTSAAIGYKTKATGATSVALGANASASASNSVALGANSVADSANTVSVGSASSQRQIAYVAAGTADTDAVNLGQLKSAAQSTANALGGGSTVNADGTITTPSYAVGGTNVGSVSAAIGKLDTSVTNNSTSISNLTNQINSGSVGLVQQNATTREITVAGGVDGGKVNFAGTQGARVLTGVANGVGANDAVNVSQLSAVKAVADQNTTDIASVNTLVDQNKTDIGNLNNNISNLTNQINSGSVGLVQQDITTREITVAGDIDGSKVNFAGTQGARVLTGVADGVDANDAVNVGQLKKTGLVDSNGDTLAAVTYDKNPDGSVNYGSVTFGGLSGAGPVQLHNVAAGTDDTDAVNVAQLKTVQAQIGDMGTQLGSAVMYDRLADGSVNFGSITLGGIGSVPVALTNVAAGAITALSTDAVNGSQLFGLQAQVDGLSGRVTLVESAPVIASPVTPGVANSAGGGTIVNVADGVAPTDAANLRQVNNAIASANQYTDSSVQSLSTTMNQRFADTNRAINDVAKNAYAGVAAAMAMPNMTPSGPGKTVVAAGGATYKGGSAAAAGATYRSRSGKWLMNGAVSVTSTGDAGVRAQAGYEF